MLNQQRCSSVLERVGQAIGGDDRGCLSFFVLVPTVPTLFCCMVLSMTTSQSRVHCQTLFTFFCNFWAVRSFPLVKKITTCTLVDCHQIRGCVHNKPNELVSFISRSISIFLNTSVNWYVTTNLDTTRHHCYCSCCANQGIHGRIWWNNSTQSFQLMT